MPEATVKEVTNTGKDGAGMFDVLMSSVETHLESQFAKNRISGTDYANVYLGSLQSALASSIQFVLGADVADAQAHLIEQQILTEEQNTLKVTADTALVNAQKLLTDEELAKITAETSLIAQKELTEFQNTLLVTATTTKTAADTTLIDKKALTEIQNELLTTAQTTKTSTETSLITSKIATEAQIALQVTQDTARSAADTTRITSEKTLLDNKALTEIQTALKVAAEINLLNQKTDTEKAQILDTVNAVAVAGIVGAQKDLYVAQKDGFSRDAEQKLLKIMMDSWAVDKSVTVTGIDIPTNLGNASINKVAADAAAGIGVTLP